MANNLINPILDGVGNAAGIVNDIWNSTPSEKTVSDGSSSDAEKDKSFREFTEPYPMTGRSAGSGGNNYPVYADAPLSTKYHMNAQTAFAEEMANTAHQREMADYAAAGLNPVLAMGSTKGADTFMGQAYSDGSARGGSGGHSRSASAAEDEIAEYGYGGLIGDLVTIFTKNKNAGEAAGRIAGALYDDKAGTGKGFFHDLLYGMTNYSAPALVYRSLTGSSSAKGRGKKR